VPTRLDCGQTMTRCRRGNGEPANQKTHRNQTLFPTASGSQGYCPTPLEHERATVYDQHFTDLETVEVEGCVEFEGKSLIERLEEIAKP